MVWSSSWNALNFKFLSRGRQVSILLRSKLRQTRAWLDGSETSSYRIQRLQEIRFPSNNPLALQDCLFRCTIRPHIQHTNLNLLALPRLPIPLYTTTGHTANVISCVNAHTGNKIFRVPITTKYSHTRPTSPHWTTLKPQLVGSSKAAYSAVLYDPAYNA